MNSYDIYKRGEIYKKRVNGERPISETTDRVFFDLGLAIKKEVNKALVTYSDTSIRSKMDLFLFVTQPRICPGSIEQIKEQLQLTGFRSIIALVGETKYFNIAHSDNTPTIIKQFKE